MVFCQLVVGNGLDVVVRGLEVVMPVLLLPVGKGAVVPPRAEVVGTEEVATLLLVLLPPVGKGTVVPGAEVVGFAEVTVLLFPVGMVTEVVAGVEVVETTELVVVVVVVVLGLPQSPSTEGTASGPAPMGSKAEPQSSLLAM